MLLFMVYFQILFSGEKSLHSHTHAHTRFHSKSGLNVQEQCDKKSLSKELLFQVFVPQFTYFNVHGYLGLLTIWDCHNNITVNIS